MSKVLIVDDEPGILAFLRRVLEADGYAVITAQSGLACMEIAASEQPDLVILDLRLPDIGGIELTSRLRRWLTAPILILSGLDDEARKVAALDAGADDYLQKPFGIDELRARVRALRRRIVDPAEHLLSFGKVTIDVASATLRLDGEEVRLTRTEWLLLETLATRPGKLLTHRRVAAEVWGEGYGDEMRQSLRGHVKSLRAKLRDDASEPLYIRTESGAGYRWIAEPVNDRGPRRRIISSPEDEQALHQLNNALTTVTLAIDNVGEVVAALADDKVRSELSEALEHGRAAAARAVAITGDLAGSSVSA